jgi:thymidylate synthase (FAD)
MTERFVQPKVFWTGYTEINEKGLRDYLEYSQNQDFLESWDKAREAGLKPAEILCSFYAKLCYKSLSLGHNANVTRTRDIVDNLANCFDVGHGSVFEHAQFNFVVTDCSRVFTHELVRHRIGTAFSQTSGRYVRLDNIPLVWDPILDPVKDLFDRQVTETEVTIYLAECKLGLRKPPKGYSGSRPDECLVQTIDDDQLPALRFAPNAEHVKWVPDNTFNFSKRKKITSAIRRIAPNGQANEIGFSVNLRSLRHTVMMRTPGFAEREIRDVFGQIYNLIKPEFPMVFHGAQEKEVDGLLEISGLKCQPYEKTAQMVLDEMSTDEIKHYLETRGQAA